MSQPAWGIELGVTCVVCPGCAFTFDAIHEDAGGGYSCPCCDFPDQPITTTTPEGEPTP